MAGALTEEQGMITIRRKSPDDAQQRQIIVKLDGENVGELFYGDTISVPVCRGAPQFAGGQYMELEDD